MPTKKQSRLLKKEQKGKGRLTYHHRKKLKRFILVAAGVLILGGIFSGGWFLGTSSSSTTKVVSEVTPTSSLPEVNTEIVSEVEDSFITPQEALNLIKEQQNNPNFVIIDDRAASEFESGHIADAINIPYKAIKDNRDNLDRNKIYLVYCPTGCGATSRTMKQQGFREVYEIKGGFNAWKSEGLPVEK
ncbi:rhodanese-like domain-containing protein [Chloroflexota bacterium]